MWNGGNDGSLSSKAPPSSLNALSVFFESGQDYGAVVDLQDPVDLRILRFLGPTSVEYDLDNVLTRIPIVELHNGVPDRLVLFEKVRFLENLAASRAWVDIVSEWELRVG